MLTRTRPAIALLTFCLVTTAPLAAQDDKSASSVVQLPSPGGTVTREEGTFTLDNNTGSANFRLPFPELPQRGRFGPSINLSYNQFAGDPGGGLGVGWGFTVPSITVNDDLGTAIPGSRPQGDFHSRLSYMGARLVFVGVDGDVWRYRAEYSEQFMEILYHPRAFEVVSLGRRGEEVRQTLPSGFEVRQADGSRLVFSGAPAVAEGNFTAAEPYVTRWPLVMQLNGNRDAVHYEYEKHGGRSYLAKVSFAGGRSVHELELIETQSSLHTHVTGTLQENARLYGKLTSRYDDSVYAQWCFGYIGRSQANNATFEVRAHADCLDAARRDLQPLIDANSVNVLDQLRILYRYGDTGGAPLAETTEQFPEITFEYSSWTAAELADRDLAFEATRMAFAGDLPPWDFELADLNMDALVDIVHSTDTGATVFAGEGELSNAFGTATTLTLSRPTEAGLLREVAPRLADDRFHFADIFGDSYVDIVEIEPGKMHVFDGRADGSFPYLGRSIALPGISPTTFTDGNGRFVDVNMDGQSDLVTTRLSADGRTEWRIFLNLTQRQPDGGHLVNFGALAKAFPFASQDGQMLSRRNVRLTDINGDRLPDFIVLRPADRGFCLYENQGNVFSLATGDLLFGDESANDPRCGAGRFARIEGMQPTENVETMWYVDANGDGIMDFASMGSRTDQLRVWLGFGDGTFLSTPLDLDLNLRVQVGSTVRGFRSRVADIDADGQSEIVVFQQSAGADVRPVVVLDFNRTAEMQLVKANLLTTVDFASGRRHDIRYATSIDEMLRDRANGLAPRKLHFPVVVAKQMVTSEGVPGQVRRDVETEEFFYHDPFYDVINSRFIGFERVDKVTYGDEFAQGERVTQKSAIARDQYYTFAEVTADLHLAGKLKARMTYEVLPDPGLLSGAATSNELDPRRTGLHSLSTATRRQGLPASGRLLRCEDAVWTAVPRGDGTSYVRKTRESLTAAAGDDQQQSAVDPACLNPAKAVTYDEFDDFNLHHIETVTVRTSTAPLGLTVPGFSRTTQVDYDESRAALAGLGIVNAVSERRILSGTRTLSRERFTYLPNSGGRLGERVLEVFSGLRDVPTSLASFHKATHTLAKSMTYDVFGNILTMSDDLGQTEAVTFDETGALPLTHTRLSGRGAGFDQVTRMSYDGERAGVVARQVTPLGVTVTFEYDSLGRRTAERADDGAEQVFAYRFGRGDRPSLILMRKRRYTSAAETPAGESEWIEQVSAYNARGNRIAEIANVAEGGVRVFNFAHYNRNAKETFRWTPFVRTSFQGETALDVRKVFDLGVIPRPEHEIGDAYTYDATGRLVRESNPSGKESELHYEPWGTRRITTYDDQFAGRVVTEQWRLSNENGLTALVLGDGQGTNHVARFVRDSFGYLSEIWLPGESEPRRLTYNSIGDLEHQAIPGMGEYFSFFDERGRQSAKASLAAGEQRLLTFTYDFLNRKLTESEDGQLRVELTYDQGVPIASAAAFEAPIARPLNEITQVRTVDPNGLFDAVQRFGYDSNGRMVQNEVEIGGNRYAESYHHTLDGRIDRSTGPRGLSAKFALGPDRNLRSVTIEHDDLSSPEKVIENIGYNAEGRIQRIDYRAGAFTDMTYDPETLFLTRIVSAAAGVPLQDLTMTFNENGSITEIVDALAAGGPARGHVDRSGRFRYDFKNQLVSFERYGVTSQFGYSPAGTFTRNDELEAGAALAAPTTAPTRLLPTGTAAKPYAFDGFGQIVSSPTLRGTAFDAQGRLIRAQTASHEVRYGYDQTGRRLYKRIVPLNDPAAAQLYLYPLDTFEVGPRGEESFVNIGTTRLVRMEHGNGRWFYYLKDHLDSSDYVISSTGVPVEQMLYRAYGTEHRPEQLSAVWGQHLAGIAGELPREKTHHRFTGKYLDDDTGLYYYGARYYDPLLGRFVSPDPLYMADPERCAANPIACNLFAYANNNPLAFIDPTGLDGVVAGDAAYRRQVEENLQRIDPTARVDAKTGEISQSWLHGLWLDIVDFFVPGSGFDTGRELVSRVIASPQTTTIEFSAGRTDTGNVDPTVDPTTTPGDVRLSYDPSVARTAPEFNAASGTVSVQAADPGIVLGHELIHATHRMAGQHAGFADVTYTGLDGVSRTGRNEEARTVGVGGTTRADDITENDLRRMLGIDPRNHYGTP